MAYNNTTNIDQAPGAGLPAGGESIPPGATRDFQPMGRQSSSVNLLASSSLPRASKPFSRLAIDCPKLTALAGATPQGPSSQSYQPTGATAEDKVQQQGHMPGLAEVQKDNEKDVRPPGKEDAAGNKIHHKSFLKKILHWEHNGMNAD